MGIGLVDDAVDVFEPAVVGILDGSADSIQLVSGSALPVKLRCNINDLQIGLGAVIRVLDGFEKSVNKNGHRLTLCRMSQIFNFSCHNFLSLSLLKRKTKHFLRKRETHGYVHLFFEPLTILMPAKPDFIGQNVSSVPCGRGSCRKEMTDGCDKEE